MNYHGITKASVVNGSGFRVVLWVSGCSHKCPGCHNPETWNPQSGKLFDNKAKQELFEALDKPYIKGITFSGGDPLFEDNYLTILNLIDEIKIKFPAKDIWLYTGYQLEELDRGRNQKRKEICNKCDYVVEGRFVKELRDITLPFRGSTNQSIVKGDLI